MRLHVLYRICASENTKLRPDFYSKAIALKSFVAALGDADGVGDVHFLCDGPIPSLLVDTMSAAGTIVDLPGLGNCGSYRRALAMLRESTWDDADLVYFAEDDYLYRHDALRRLRAAALAIPQASYFTPYDHPDYVALVPHLRFRARHARERWTVDGQGWRSVRGTTMTFGARVGTMRMAAPIHELGSRGDAPRDWEIWSSLQTASAHFLLGALRFSDTLQTKPLVRSIPKRFRRRDLLVAPCPSLATHLEQPFLAGGVNWRALAREYAT